MRGAEGIAGNKARPFGEREDPHSLTGSLNNGQVRRVRPRNIDYQSGDTQKKAKCTSEGVSCKDGLH